jgi:hypothetical protein
VQAVLDAHPAESGRCREAARGVLPLARNVDELAAIAKLLPRPGLGWFVCPARRIDARWSHHFSVRVCEHLVDALSGPDGTPAPSYLAQHWRYPEALQWVDPDPAELEQHVGTH